MIGGHFSLGFSAKLVGGDYKVASLALINTEEVSGDTLRSDWVVRL